MSEEVDENTKNRLIADFVNVSQSSPDEAQELLEASHWNVEAALMEFYKEGEEEENESNNPILNPPRGSSLSPFGNVLGGGVAPPQPVASNNPQTKPKTKVSKRFATIADLSGNASKESTPSHSGSDEDEAENFFTGGEKSGLAVQNPGDGLGQSSGRLINDIFKQAQRNQVKGSNQFSDDDDDDEDEDDIDDIEGSSSFGRFNRNRKSGKQQSFGPGFTLGSNDVPSRPVIDPTASNLSQRPPRVVRQLTFWKDGFSVEDGPLFRYDDPENIAHLEAINSGKAPLSLLNVENGQGVDVRIIRKMDENYSPPKRKPGGFHGQGNRLGSPVPGEFSTSNSASSSIVNLPTASSTVPPATTTTTPASTGDAPVQIRLADGRALRARFQSAGTIQQLYDYVQTNQSSNESRNYVLQTTFPNKELSDKSITLKEAGVVGAVVVQKFV